MLCQSIQDRVDKTPKFALKQAHSLTTSQHDEHIPCISFNRFLKARHLGPLYHLKALSLNLFFKITKKCTILDGSNYGRLRMSHHPPPIVAHVKKKGCPGKEQNSRSGDPEDWQLMTLKIGIRRKW